MAVAFEKVPFFAHVYVTAVYVHFAAWMTELARVAKIVEVVKWMARKIVRRGGPSCLAWGDVNFNFAQLETGNPVILTATVTAAGATVTRPRKRGRVEQNSETPVPLFSISASVTAYRNLRPAGRSVGRSIVKSRIILARVQTCAFAKLKLARDT